MSRRSRQTQSQSGTQSQNQSFSGSSAQNFSNNAANRYAYDWLTPPDTEDVRRAREFEFQVDPSIATTYASARNRIANTFNSPTGGNYSPQMRDVMLRSTYRDMAQQQAGDRSRAYNETQGQRLGQRMAVAAMTQPRMVASGSTSSSTGTSSGTNQGTSQGSGTFSGQGVSTTSQPVWPELMSGAVMGASA